MLNCNAGDTCICDCHRSEGVYHCMPCCYPCPHCGRRISTSSYPFHINSCKEEQEKLNKKLEDIIKRNDEISNG